MGEAAEFGFGLSVGDLDGVCLESDGAADVASVGARRPRLSELFPPECGTDAWIVGELQELQAREAADAAYRAALVAELAARRPAAADPVIGRAQVEQECGAAPAEGVSEFFPDELALVLNSSRTAATVLLELAQTLLTRLPATWAALADGRLDWPRARARATELGRPVDDTDPTVVTAVEAAVLPPALGGLSVRRLRDLIKTELLARDPLAAD